MTIQRCTRCHQLKTHRARGYCNSCYVVVRATGEPTGGRARKLRKYVEKECSRCHRVRKHEAKGLCASCYQVLRRSKIMSTMLDPRPESCVECGRGWDEAKYHAKGYCSACYQRVALADAPGRRCACGAVKSKASRARCHKCYLKDVTRPVVPVAPVRSMDEAAALDPGLAAFLRASRARKARAA